MIAAAVAVVVLLAVGGYLLFLRDGDGGGGFFGGGDDADTVPAFEFALGKAVAVTTSGTDPKELTDSASAVQGEIVEPITRLYTEAFLDPASWREGAYDEVWPVFDEGASVSAREDVDVLTLGAPVGDVFETVLPRRGKLSVQVLMDGEDSPVTAVAIVKFAADAEGTDGALTAIVSSGQYFLRLFGDGWKVYSYEVTREDHARGGATSASPSPTEAAG